MLYRGFWIKITRAENLKRELPNGEVALYNGFEISVYSDDSERFLLDRFTAVSGYEIRNESEQEVEQFIKDVIDAEEKEYIRTMDEHLKMGR